MIMIVLSADESTQLTPQYVKRKVETISEEESRIKSYCRPETTMRTTQQFSITLPNEMADAVKSKVATGEYATESEVIRDGLRALLARDRAVESWLHEQVGPAYDALKADPARAVTIDDVRASLAAEHKAAVAKTFIPSSSRRKGGTDDAENPDVER
jgi:putative addiction module CopG family antidote